MQDMKIHDACVKNLKHVSLTLPRNQCIVFTGVSGSGKSSLAKDVIYMECQRQYLEAISLEGIPKPNVGYIKHTSPAIIITQQTYHKNPRSTVGTITNIYTDLRMMYEKLGMRRCSECAEEIDPTQCVEEVEKRGGDFQVFLYCPHCEKRIPAITRTHFSYNTGEGACPSCHGLGTKITPRIEAIIDEEKAIHEGGIRFFEKRYGAYQSEIFFQALQYYQIACPSSTKCKDFTPQQRTLLLYGVDSEEVRALFPNQTTPKKVSEGKFEGVLPILMRRVSQKGSVSDVLQEYFYDGECEACHGERLQELAREVRIGETRLPQLMKYTLEDLQAWIVALKITLEPHKRNLVQVYIQDMETKIQRYTRIGLSYLSLHRQAMTLSTGEAQRLKLSAVLDSEVTGILYILDEPTIGLHAKDTKGIIEVLQQLKEKGNTILVIEHDPDIMKAADQIVEIGPYAGIHGGEIVHIGTWEENLMRPNSLLASTMQYKAHKAVSYQQCIHIEDAYMHNLKHCNVDIPLGVLTCVSGVSGSGKSTLIFQVLANSVRIPTGCHSITGLDQIDEVICIHQNTIARSRRSNIATYSGVYDEIRQLYGTCESAKKQQLPPKYFSFNVEGGRCDACDGLGYVVRNMLFFEDVEVSCPICHGQRFKETVLSVKVKEKHIVDVLDMSVEEAITHFQGETNILNTLQVLQEVGLSYVTLGQSLTTLSGGEIQRLKLATQLIRKKKTHTLYLMDEPTTGLHPYDIEQFMKLLRRLVEEGNSIVVIEHNIQLLSQADWLIDLGKEGGIQGGEIIVQGQIDDIIACEASYTGAYLKRYMQQ